MPKGASARHGAAHLNALQAQVFDLAADFGRDQLVHGDDHLVGADVDDVLPLNAAFHRVFSRTSTFSPRK